MTTVFTERTTSGRLMQSRLSWGLYQLVQQERASAGIRDWRTPEQGGENGKGRSTD